MLPEQQQFERRGWKVKDTEGSDSLMEKESAMSKLGGKSMGEKNPPEIKL